LYHELRMSFRLFFKQFLKKNAQEKLAILNNSFAFVQT
jgi:hypothetical protein